MTINECFYHQLNLSVVRTCFMTRGGGGETWVTTLYQWGWWWVEENIIFSRSLSLSFMPNHNYLLNELTTLPHLARFTYQYIHSIHVSLSIDLISNPITNHVRATIDAETMAGASRRLKVPLWGDWGRKKLYNHTTWDSLLLSFFLFRSWWGIIVGQWIGNCACVCLCELERWGWKGSAIIIILILTSLVVDQFGLF